MRLLSRLLFRSLAREISREEISSALSLYHHVINVNHYLKIPIFKHIEVYEKILELNKVSRTYRLEK